MPWSGGVFTRTNGTYTGPTVWASDAAAAIKIQSSRHDTHDQDLAQGINNTVAKDGSNVITILNLSGTVNASSGIIMVGSVVLASTYGTNNAFFGDAGNFTLSGFGNFGFGNGVLPALTSGNTNSALGMNALHVVTSGSNNSALGAASLQALTVGSHNTSVGDTALTLATSGSDNTALGSAALSLVSTGSNNSALGFGACNDITSGSNNVGIGRLTNVNSATADNQLSIQNALYGVSNAGTNATISTGNLGVYVKAPTARLHFIAGTATAGTAPLKLTAGTNLTTPENGALEFDGTHLYITISGVRTTIV